MALGAVPLIRSDRAAAGVLVVGALDLGLEQFMILPILPAVQQAYGASITATAWLVTGFLLTAVASAPVLGRLGDLYGKRRVLLVAIGAFAIGSLVCALADSVGWLIAGRVIQGVGAGLGPLAIGIARDRAPPGRAPVWIGLLIACAGAGAAVGLVAGGFLVQHVSVAAVFWVLVGIACVLFLGVVLFVPESPARGSASRPDWIGSLLLTAALLAFLLAVTHGNTWGWDSWRVVMLLVVSALVLVIFAGFERSSPAPLVDMHLLAQRPAWSANLVAFSLGFALFIAGLVVPRIATLPTDSGYGLGLTYAQAGLVLLPGALGIVAGGWAAGVLVRRVGARLLVASGALVAAVGYAGLALDHGSVAAVVVSNLPVGLGIGLAFATLTNLVVRSVDETRTAVFAATVAVSRSTGAALGTQIAAATVIAAGVSSGYPIERGFTGAFVLGLVAALVALTATAAIPPPRADPLVADPSAESSPVAV
jgi:MFS family permease